LSRDRSIICLSEAVSPITHMSGASGNEAIVSREPVVTPSGVQHVPYLSGNAIRHRMVRAPGWRRLIGEMGLGGRLSLSQLNFLMHGGSLTEGGPSEDLRRIVDWQRLFPLGRLLGGCLPDQILAGTLQVDRGTLACRENARVLEHDAPEAVAGLRLRPASSFVGGYQYTRGSAAKAMADAVEPDAEPPASSNLMIFSGEHVVAGAMFVHGFRVAHAEPVELGALLTSLDLWAEAGGTIGGMSARGHGRLRTWIVAGVDEAEAGDARAAYAAHVEAVKGEATAWLEAAFAPRARAARGKTPRAKAEPAREGDPEPVAGLSAGPSLFGDESGGD